MKVGDNLRCNFILFQAEFCKLIFGVGEGALAPVVQTVNSENNLNELVLWLTEQGAQDFIGRGKEVVGVGAMQGGA